MSKLEQHFEGFDHEPEEESRSAQKRAAQALRKLCDDIADLGVQSYRALVMPEHVREAFDVARGLKPRSDERRRQLQYAAKLLRAEEGLDLKQQIEGLGASVKVDPNAMRLEQLREEFIAHGKEAIDAFVALIVDTDRNKLRVLVKKAQQEAAKAEPGAEKPAARQLFKYVKAELARAKVEIPASLL
ncbi:MAG: DUF615 domain-containing protein [Succinivibrio sp.]|nr:DUF615 domain-containing protein [Succinivibrio sp.]